ADSGGPVTCLSGSRWVQAGVLSFAIGCGRASGPGLATALTEHADWLQKHLGPEATFVTSETAPPPGLEDGKCYGERAANRDPHQEAESWLAVTPNGHRGRGARLALHGAFVSMGQGRDLALLSLETPLPIGPELRPLCLPYRDHKRPPGTRCWALMGSNGE
ncbi:polyserase-2-like, partial [Coturnix japonica]|uniref:polyserase-2-like n=1 Tax=Coturnix japonica TaxID=93934 RepID=UPI0013A5D140